MGSRATDEHSRLRGLVNPKSTWQIKGTHTKSVRCPSCRQIIPYNSARDVAQHFGPVHAGERRVAGATDDDRRATDLLFRSSSEQSMSAASSSSVSSLPPPAGPQQEEQDLSLSSGLLILQVSNASFSADRSLGSKRPRCACQGTAQRLPGLPLGEANRPNTMHCEGKGPVRGGTRSTHCWASHLAKHRCTSSCDFRPRFILVSFPLRHLSSKPVYYKLRARQNELWDDVHGTHKFHTTEWLQSEFRFSR